MKTHLQGMVLIIIALLLSGCADESSDQSEDGNNNSTIALPNIVIVLADDKNWMDSGAFGNPDVKTPNIDRLAHEGLKLTQVFTATAMCAPTRQQLYTGIYPVRSGAYPQNSFVKDGTKSLVHYFEAMGYRVGLSGKRHFSPEGSFPFERVNSRSDKEAPNFDRIKEFVSRDASQPFFLVLASRQPHTPWNRGEVIYDPETLTVPDDLVDTTETRQALANYYREVSDFDSELGRMLDIVDEAGVSDNTIFIYTSEQGAMYPHAKWTLYDKGIHTAMVIRWPGVVQPGSESDALIAYVDVVPTLVDAVGGDLPEVDGSSFLGVIKGEKNVHNNYVYGVHTSLGICNGSEYPIRSVRDKHFKLIVNGNAGEMFSNNITVRNSGKYYQSWRVKGEAGDESAMLVFQQYQNRAAEEFYDLGHDPLELHNLIEDANYTDDINRLRASLNNWLDEQGDTDIMATEKAAPDHMLAAGKLKLLTAKCGG